MSKKKVEFQPLLIGGLSNRGPEMCGIRIIRVQIIKYTECTKTDLPKIAVVGRDRLERPGDPLGAPPEHKRHFFEFCRSRKVDRAQRGVCKERLVVVGNVGDGGSYRKICA